MDVQESVSQEVVFWNMIDTLSGVSYKSHWIPAGNGKPHLMINTILIADDHDDNRELLLLLLSGAGYEVREAKDGSECLAIARDQRPDLILMDLSMPGLDGWEVFRELKNRPAHSCHTLHGCYGPRRAQSESGPGDRFQRLRFEALQRRCPPEDNCHSALKPASWLTKSEDM